MKTSNERNAIEEFLRSSMLKYEADYSYQEECRYEIAAALEPVKKNKSKEKYFLEV